MEPFVYYLLRVSVYLFVFAAAYRLLFRKQDVPTFNRYYLLLSSGASLLLGLLPYRSIPVSAAAGTENLPVFQLPEFVLNAPEAVTETGTMIGSKIAGLQFTGLFYLLVSAVLLLLLLWRIVAVARLVTSYKTSRHEGMVVVFLPNGHVPFSFLKWVFIPESLADHKSYPMVLAHEKAHFERGHSLDVLFFELMHIVFWFHPVMYYLRAETKTLHEFEADQQALNHYTKADYQQTLLDFALAGKALALVNPFNVSPLKIRMMKMNQKTRESLVKHWLKLMLILPLAIVALLVQSCFSPGEEVKKQEEPTLLEQMQEQAREKGMDISLATDGGQRFMTNDSIFTVVEEMPRYPGGMEAMMAFISNNIRYPEEAKTKGIEGRVFVNFIVEVDGKVTNAQILRGIGGGCDEEAIRVVELMPAWTPGYQRGQAVRVSFNLPVRFTLEK